MMSRLEMPRSLERSGPGPVRPVVVYGRDHVEATAFPAHLHADFAQLICCIEGGASIGLESERWLLPPGYGLFLPPGTRHAVSCPARSVLRTVSLWSVPATAIGAQPRLLAINTLVAALLDKAADFTEDRLPTAAELRLLQVIIDCLLEADSIQFSLPLGRDSRLRQITEAMLADPALGLGLAAWAQKAGASERTLSRLFASDLGMSFRKYRQLVQAFAAVMRMAGGAPIKIAALDVGYASPASFSAAFHNLTGLSPRDFLKRMPPQLARPNRRVGALGG